VSGSIRACAAIGSTVAHDNAFYVRLSGRRNLEFYASLRGDEPRKAAGAIIEEMELGFTSERVDRYSSGMLQQLAFARALLGDPRLLLLDEPTRSLDEAAVTRLWAALDRRERLAVVIASHRREDLARCGKEIRLS
jgi:ABC-2 type transport system ATP-binding protein